MGMNNIFVAVLIRVKGGVSEVSRSNIEHRLGNKASRMDSEFDFIVVGGGTSGLVVANRLTENPGVQVLVLEAGENHIDDPRVSKPSLFGTLFGSEADWDFKTQAQVNLHEA